MKIKWGIRKTRIKEQIQSSQEKKKVFLINGLSLFLDQRYHTLITWLPLFLIILTIIMLLIIVINIYWLLCHSICINVFMFTFKCFNLYCKCSADIFLPLREAVKVNRLTRGAVIFVWVLSTVCFVIKKKAEISKSAMSTLLLNFYMWLYGSCWCPAEDFKQLVALFFH